MLFDQELRTVKRLELREQYSLVDIGSKASLLNTLLLGLGELPDVAVHGVLCWNYVNT